MLSGPERVDMSSTAKTMTIQDAGVDASQKAAGQSPFSSEPAENLGKAFSSLCRSFTLYPSNHPLIKDGTHRLLEILRELLSETDRVTVGFLGNDLMVLGKQLRHIEGSIPGLNRLVQERGIEKIVFLSGVDEHEIIQFFSVFSAGKEKEQDKRPENRLRQGEWPHILSGRFKFEASVADFGQSGACLDLDGVSVVKEFLASSQALVSQAREKNLIEFDLAKEIIENILSGMILEDDAVPIVARIKKHDEYTYTHILNVSTLTLAMGRILGFTPQQLRELGLAALLHDTGKLLIPLEILQKEGELTDEEFAVIKEHPVHGAGMLMKVPGMPDMVPIVAFEHHMWYNGGGGYPLIHKEGSPHLYSRMTSIADIFDALRTNRAYRTEVSKEETLRRMSVMQIDPFLFNVFARISNLYPVGDYVRLDTGEIGVVHEIHPRNALRPKVRILYDQEGNQIETQRILNLANYDKNKNRFISSITSSLSAEETAGLS
ncbi:MAG: hypothetical protein CO150_00690 [Nitrospirae bacterium CG_4_9_14_3_um_filter_53_35]|nr:MAG: hypothetical protein COT35_03750 [Nitrospirae bacterium CG08_land_8_20_14_0_20_52_24]PIX87064.1 MAG: hypothetical protein COZ32_00240 [Nitrospirae bacterium CG_4_10_14_3_um_filter_53_41]PJA77496.1 MAG: hypothetical protein CO150_00690 [Nitrospirae bacterium CG_4_9_14_3_um_filter_53_35]